MDDKVFNQLVAQHLEKKIAMCLQSCPCQDFSTAGKRDTSNPRAFLYERGLEFLEKVNSVNQYAFIENVPAFLSAKLDGKVKIIDIIKAKLEELKASAEKYKTIDNDMKKAVEKVISMAVNISNIFDKATPDKQNQLLRLLLTDCKLNGKRLEYKLKAPFDRLLSCKNHQDWPQIAVENLGEFGKIRSK